MQRNAARSEQRDPPVEHEFVRISSAISEISAMPEAVPVVAKPITADPPKPEYSSDPCEWDEKLIQDEHEIFRHVLVDYTTHRSPI